MQDASNRTISLRELKWDVVDKSAREHDFLDRSPFVEFCLMQVIYPKRNKHLNMRTLEVIVLILMAIMMLILLLR